MQEITSMDEYQNGMRQNQRILLDFSASWCGPCKMLLPQLDAMRAEYPSVAFFKVDVESMDQLADLYQVSAMPTIIMLKEGKVFQRVEGANVALIRSSLEKLSA